jgi:hypothetical protein
VAGPPALAATGAACAACHCSLARAALPAARAVGLLPDSDVFTALGAVSMQQLLGSCAADWAAEAAGGGGDGSSSVEATAGGAVGRVELAARVAACPLLARAAVGACLLTAAGGGAGGLINNVMARATQRAGGPASVKAVGAHSDGGGAAGAGPGVAAAARRAVRLPRGWAEVLSSDDANALRRSHAAVGFGPGRWTTSGPVSWRAGCFCRQGELQAVCDPVTRVQYPSACAAACQVRSGVRGSGRRTGSARHPGCAEAASNCALPAHPAPPPPLSSDPAGRRRDRTLRRARPAAGGLGRRRRGRRRRRRRRRRRCLARIPRDRVCASPGALARRACWVTRKPSPFARWVLVLAVGYCLLRPGMKSKGSGGARRVRCNLPTSNKGCAGEPRQSTAG